MQFKKKKLYSINPLRDLFEDYIDRPMKSA